MKALAPIALIAALASMACSPASADKASAQTPAPAPSAAPAAATAAPVPAAPTVDPAFDAWVRDQVKDGGLPLQYAAAAGPDGLSFAWLTGGDYCGSGGCVLLVARRIGSGFERVGRLTVVRTPVRVLDSRSHGLPDLAVRVSGGGAAPHEALIPFDGTRYASNPTVDPARPVGDAAPGRTLITDDTPKVTVRE